VNAYLITIRRALNKAPGQQPDNEVVAQLGATTLLEIFGHDTESDWGFCWEYVQAYAEKAKLEPIAACQRVLKRTCDAVALILDTAEGLSQPAAQAATGAPEAVA